MKRKFRLEYTARFERRLKTLDIKIQLTVLREIIELKENPFLGKPLNGSLKGTSSLRVGDYRVIYKVQSEKILILTVGHRKQVYKP